MQLWSLVTLATGAIWLLISKTNEFKKIEKSIFFSEKKSGISQVRSVLCATSVKIMLFIAVGIFMFNHGLNNWLPELLRSRGMDATQAGYWASIPTVIGLIGSILIPRFATPNRRFFIFSILIVIASLASVLLLNKDGPILFSALILQGIARSSLMTLAILILVELPNIGKKHAGTASGLFFSAAEIGGVSGPLLLGTCYDLTGSFNLGLNTLTGLMILLFCCSLYLQKVIKNNLPLKL
jgi:cyanate permease